MRQQIRRMERGYSNKERAAVSTDVEKLDNCLGGKGLRLGRVHEIINTGRTDAKDVSSLGFVVALLVRILNVTNYNKRVLWCSGKKKVLNSQLSATGLYWLGFDPNQLIQANVLSETDQYWVMEECLKCSELAAVVIELAHAKPQFNNRESIVWRRLQLAAESSGVTGFVLRSCANIMETTSSIPESRWGVKSLPSNDWRPMWKLELLKSRNGRYASVNVVWDPATSSFSLSS